MRARTTALAVVTACVLLAACERDDAGTSDPDPATEAGESADEGSEDDSTEMHGCQ